MRFRPHRNFAELADEGLVARIIGVHRHRAVTQHGFGPGGGDGDIIAGLAQGDIAVFIALDIFIGGPARERILKMPHMAVDLDVFHLKVGNRGLEFRVPVDQPRAFIDQAFVIHIDKDLEHRIMKALIHGKTVARPVTARPQPLELLDDGITRLRFPVPYLFQKLLAPQRLAPRLSGFGQLPLDHHLRGDACVVLPRLPQGIKPLHALPADQDILQGVVEGMAHVQNAGHVRRRDHDAKGFVAAGIGPGLESPRRFPFRINPRLA